MSDTANSEILYEFDYQRDCPHISWQKVEAIDETYLRCFSCEVTADKPVAPTKGEKK